MLKRTLASITSILCAGLIAVNAAAFEKEDLLEYFAEGDTMTLYVSGISGEDVSCRIAGQEYTAAVSGNICSDGGKYKTLFLIDTSTSMRHYSDKIYEALHGCIEKKPQNEYYSIAVFSGSSFSVIAGFESDRYELEKIIGNIKYDAQSSYIYDNADKAVKSLAEDDDKCYERIVLFTDGCENSATGISIDELLETINRTPVQIYTVTFVNSKKDNYEKLKNVARIARASGASDIRIKDDTDITKEMKILSDDAASISSIVVTGLKSPVADGSRRPIELVAGGVTVKSEVVTPMISPADETVTSEETTYTETEITSETTSEVTSETEKTEPAKKSSARYILIICVIAAAAAAVITSAVLIVSGKSEKKRGKNTEQTSPDYDLDDDNDDTVMITSDGETEMLFDGGRAVSAIILRDIASTDHTFEASLSDAVVVGRSPERCSVVIDYDKSVSKRHCRIFARGGDVYIEDMGSANKTYVNGAEISSAHILRNADEIKLGRVRFKVTIR